MPREAAGRRGTCKKCGTGFSIPHDEGPTPPLQLETRATASSLAEPVTPAQLLQLLSDSVVFPKQSVHAAHRLVAGLVAVAMLILPLLYIGFIAGVAGLTWWHIRYDGIWIKASFGYAKVVAAALYIGLGLGGIVWTLSLVRPLFMRFRSEEGIPGLLRAEEPVLFAFAERLADRVGCPRPQIIRLNLDVNASAGYETSLFGLRRRAFTLTLGLPLVRGMTLCQLAGIMAHEFGHFGQRNSSFLTRFITRTNSWFVVAVSQRDLLDALIETLAEAGHYLATLVAFLLLVLGTVLFRSFNQRSTAVTLRLYEHRHGRGLTADAIRPASEVVDAYLEASSDNPSGIPAGRIDGLFHSRL